MIIRRYRPSDQGAVIALFREFMWELAPPSLGGEFQAYIERAIGEELGRIEEYYFKRPDQGFWVAETGAVIGMVGIERCDADTAELRRMAVARAQRKKGVGRALLATAEAFCVKHGYRKLVLWTQSNLLEARRIYQACGFRLKKKERHQTFGVKLVGEYWELVL